MLNNKLGFLTEEDFLEFAQMKLASEQNALKRALKSQGEVLSQRGRDVVDCAATNAMLANQNPTVQRRYDVVTKWQSVVNLLENDGSVTDCSRLEEGMFAFVRVFTPEGTLTYEGAATVVSGEGEARLGWYNKNTPIGQCLLGSSPGRHYYSTERDVDERQLDIVAISPTIGGLEEFAHTVQ